MPLFKMTEALSCSCSSKNTFLTLKKFVHLHQKLVLIVIMLDESLDIATNKKLIIVHDNQVRLEFCANISIPDGTTGTLYNCIIKWLRDVGINLKKVNDIALNAIYLDVI
jgi:hypothetical protein